MHFQVDMVTLWVFKESDVRSLAERYADLLLFHVDLEVKLFISRQGTISDWAMGGDNTRYIYEGRARATESM